MRNAEEQHDSARPAVERDSLSRELPSISQGCSEWTALVPEREWSLYQEALDAIERAGVRSMLGGAFGLAGYTGRWRNTKDIDFFVLPEDREKSIQALTNIGFSDYYDTLAYDRGWIYRATRDELIVDVIWATPNRRTVVDEAWLENAPRLQLSNRTIGIVPAEELLWIKLYVVQRDRCDWPDVINLLYATAPRLNWDRLIARLADDLPLLDGVLCLFAWLCPDRVKDIPAPLRKRLSIRRPSRAAAAAPDQARITRLDSRPWFAALQPLDQPMKL